MRVKKTFYKDLEKVHRSISQNDMHILLGDFKAHIGNDTDAWPNVKHAYHSEANDNSTHLDFCAIQDYIVGGTLFEHKDIHKASWVSPKGDTTTQIDHIHQVLEVVPSGCA